VTQVKCDMNREGEALHVLLCRFRMFDASSWHRLIWWGGCDIDLQWTQCYTGPYCVNQSLSYTCIYEETRLSLI